MRTRSRAVQGPWYVECVLYRMCSLYMPRRAVPRPISPKRVDPKCVCVCVCVCLCTST
jgi:hypothetical protein